MYYSSTNISNTATYSDEADLKFRGLDYEPPSRSRYAVVGKTTESNRETTAIDVPCARSLIETRSTILIVLCICIDLSLWPCYHHQF